MTTVPLTATYSTAGTFTWTCPPGVTSVTVACTGAGGGGGAAAGTSGSNGGGGGAGEAALEPSVGVTPGLSYQVIVGAAGAGGTQGGNGAAGGDSSFTGDLPSGGLSSGPSAVVYAHGGAGGTAAVTGAGQGASGGTGSVNSVSADGGDGDDGTVSSNGGGGGGAAGSSLVSLAGGGGTGYPGNDASGSTAGAASGGTYPGGAGGAGSTSGSGPGAGGSAPGGAGGGALSTGTGRAGGAGANGQVVVAWTMTDPVTLVASTAGATVQFTAPAGASSVTAQAWGAGAGGYNTGTSGGTGVAGFSAFTSTYGSPRSAAAATVNSYVGQPVALAAQVVYYSEEEYPSSGNDSQNVAQLAAMGCKVVAAFKLSRRAVVSGGSTLTAQQSAFAAGLAYLQTIPGLNFYVCIGNEPNGFGVNGPFGNGSNKDWNKPNPYTLSGTQAQQAAQTAANYLAYYAAYVPTVVAAGLQAAYKPVVFSTGMGISMFPGAGSAHGGCDLILADWYATDYTKNSEDLFGAGNLEGAADTAGIPLGIGEWGAVASGVLPSGWKNSDWTGTWMPHFLGGFQSRLNAGKPVADIIYFGADSPSGANAISGASDYKCPGIASVYTALNQVQASGGAGGGGGEFAQESALAITGLSSYTLVTGAGGATRASGTASTVAGDSVTVTAHGGSAATAVGAGGTGGTGSANGTHHDGGAGGAGGGTNGGGGGGGGSGGTGAGGNAGAAGGGNFGGAGGAAVTNGGPGGKGGGPNLNGSPPMAGPGGGGGARGANGLTNGQGSDGQVTLSSFVTHPACTGGLALAGLGFSGSGGGGGGGSLALAPAAFAGTGTVTQFSQVQLGTIASGTGSAAPALSATNVLSTVFAVVETTGTTAVTGTAGWVKDTSQQQGGGGGGIISIWRYPALAGSITGATFTGGGGDTIRAFLVEVAAPPGYTPALDGSPATASGATGATSFPVTMGSATGIADMAIAAFLDRFTSSSAGTWTTPSGWSLLRSQTSITNPFAAYAQYTTAAGTLSVSGTFSTSTSQTGWAGALAVYTAVPLNTSAGAVALAGFGFSGAGNVAVGPTQVVSTGGVNLAGLGFQSPSLAATFPGAPLPVLVEILLNGTWTAITNYVRQTDGISISGRGRPDEASTAQPTQVTLTIDNRDGSFSPQNSAGQFYPFLVRNTQIRISVVNAVTPQGAWYSGYRFWGEVPAWPPLWDVSGNNVYVSIAACGVLQRMRQSKYSASAVTRYYTNMITQTLGQGQAQANPGLALSGGLIPAGYWPCEDGTNSGTFASGIPGGSPMTWTGTPGLAADNSVAGSQPFAQLSGSIWTGTPGAFSSGGITFAIPGTYQWVCPGGVTSVLAECWGGGGGGSDGRFGCGGGGGEYAAEPALQVTPGKTYTLVVGAGGSGGAGGFSLSGQAGGTGAVTTFSGDSVTVMAHGGKGISSKTQTAAGGSGSPNTTHHNGGHGGGQAGGGNGGAGGGGSGGSGSSGNNGGTTNSNSPGNGASAVTGGGPGGNGGTGGSNVATPGMSPSPGPGGGGGGGGFNSYNQFGERGGNGFAGQVRLTFGTSTTPNANVLRFIADVPSGGGTDGAYLGQITTTGTIADLHVKWHTGGSLELVGKDKNGSQLFTSGSHSFGALGSSTTPAPLLVSAELTQSGTKVNWKLTALAPGASAVVATYTGTQSSATLGPVTQVNVNNAPSDADTTATGIGQVVVAYQVDPILNLSQPLAAYAGELAATRFLRLCGEQRIPATLTGSLTDTPQMGPQPAGLLVDLLQDCENADLGQMYEQRGTFGMGYRTRVSMQNQGPGVVLDYSLAQLVPPLTPVDDDQLTRNDIIATRSAVAGSVAGATGTSYEAIQSTGPLSVLDPPNGVGLYQYTYTPNLFTDAQLAAFATWILTLGTLDEYRYPLITVNMIRASVADGTFPAMASLDIGGYLQIVSPPPWLPSGPINQLAFGFSETINSYEWVITVNAVPEDPYTGTGLPTW